MLSQMIRCLFYHEPMLMSHFIVAECPECARLGEYEFSGHSFLDCATCATHAVPDKAGDPAGLCVASDRIKRTWALRGPALCAVLRGYAAREVPGPDAVRDMVLETFRSAAGRQIAAFELHGLRRGNSEYRFLSAVELAAFTFADCSLPLSGTDPAAAIMPMVTATYDGLPALDPGAVSSRLGACRGCPEHRGGQCARNRLLVAPRAFWPGKPWPEQPCPKELWPDDAAVAVAR